MTDRKLVIALACRNEGSRRWGKPLQNLDIEKGISILDVIIASARRSSIVSELVLGISEGTANQIYAEYAKKNGLLYCFGDEKDVLSRLIKCGDTAGATDILRITSESPFRYTEMEEELWSIHLEEDNDATFLDDIVDGCGSEFIKLEALKTSHARGEDRHRSELCTLFIRENPNIFKTRYMKPSPELVRMDLRFTVDYPEDLVVCRAVHEAFDAYENDIPLAKALAFMDANPQLKALTAPFCEDGYATMYVKPEGVKS